MNQDTSLLSTESQTLISTSSLQKNPQSSSAAYNKEKILNYIFDSDFFLLGKLLSEVPDVLSGGFFPFSGDRYGDGEFFWDETLGLYVLLYDIPLPKEFVEKIEQDNRTHKSYWNWHLYGKVPYPMLFQDSI